MRVKGGGGCTSRVFSPAPKKEGAREIIWDAFRLTCQPQNLTLSLIMLSLSLPAIHTKCQPAGMTAMRDDSCRATERTTKLWPTALDTLVQIIHETLLNQTLSFVHIIRVVIFHAVFE